MSTPTRRSLARLGVGGVWGLAWHDMARWAGLILVGRWVGVLKVGGVGECYLFHMVIIIGWCGLGHWSLLFFGANNSFSGYDSAAISVLKKVNI